jgi:Uma2 family endonuclease
MGQPQPKQPEIVTLAEFLEMAWDDDLRRELYDGQIVAMAPPASGHGILTANLVFAVRRALRDRPCRVAVEVGIIPPGRQHSFYQADLVLSCEPHRRGDREIRAPQLIVEVLSPTTTQVDFQRKLPDYRELPTVREVVLLDSERMFAEVHRRLDGRWTTDQLHGPKASLWLTCADLQLPLGELYEGLDVADDELPAAL